MREFKTEILLIGINPYTLVPEPVLQEIFMQAAKAKSPIPVKGTLNGIPFIQTLVKFRGKWRLYLNNPMRKSVNGMVGDIVKIKLRFDPTPGFIHTHPDLADALAKNQQADSGYQLLSASRKKEINLYLHHLKNNNTLSKNIEKLIRHLSEQ
jgi:hypothetical protein